MTHACLCTSFFGFLPLEHPDENPKYHPNVLKIMESTRIYALPTPMENGLFWKETNSGVVVLSGVFRDLPLDEKPTDDVLKNWVWKLGHHNKTHINTKGLLPCVLTDFHEFGESEIPWIFWGQRLTENTTPNLNRIQHEMDRALYGPPMSAHETMLIKSKQNIEILVESENTHHPF